MSNAERRKALIAPSDEIMKKAANGNKAALQYMQQIGQVARILDDLVDMDHRVEPVNIIAVFRWLLVGCYKNSFFHYATFSCNSFFPFSSKSLNSHSP